MLRKTTNKVYDPFLKAEMGYKNLERLKKAIVAQPKMYDGEKFHSAKLIIDSPDSEETLKDAEESIENEKQNEVTSDLPIPKMPKESKLLKMFEKMGVAINGLRTRIDKTLLEERQRRWMSDSQNSLREFYKTDVIPMSASLSKNLKELKEELIEEKNKLLKAELERSSSDSKYIEANLLKRIKILENDFKRSQAQSIDFELKLQHQKEKMACDVSWKSKLSTINDENVLLKTQEDSIVQERENIKLEHQKRFNSIKATRTQHQKGLDELIEDNKLKTIDKGKNVNTKFDKSETFGTLLCVTLLPKNIALKANKVSNSKVNADRSKPVTSHSTPKNEQSRTQNENVLVRGMYRITKTKTQTPDSKTNINVCNSTGVESSNSVKRPKSKDTKSKNRVLKNTNDKRPSAHVRKMSRSVSIDYNKRETKHLNVCQSNTSVLSTKTVNAVNDGLNIVCISCGKDVLLRSHENVLLVMLFAKSRLSVAKTPTATNKVSSVLPLSPDSSQSRTLSNYMKNKIATSRKWQKWFEYQQSFNWTPKNKTAQSLPSETKSRDPTRPLDCLGHNLFVVGQFYDGDLEVAFLSNTCYVWNLEVDDLLTGSRDSNLYTISIFEMAASSLVRLISKATSTKSWLWHRRLSHLNFGTINQLKKKDLVDGLLKFKYNKNHLCLACEQGKSKKTSLPPKLVPSTESKLELLHMDLYGPMRVASINGKKYILVIVDDYSRYTWFDELTTMASECNNSEPGINCTNFQDSSEDSQSVPSKIDLDNLFGPLYEEYYATSSPEVSDNSAVNTLDNENTSSSSSIVVEEDEAPQIVSSSAEQVAAKPNSLVLNENADELV
ncbi:retrovirus-related pol polyprotein from transposon TNT 1-94 [Tanacetum coccineum]